MTFRIHRSRLVLCSIIALQPPSARADARGVSDPVVSWGLNGLSDWDTAQPFLDLARVMRPFFAFAPEEWESMSHDDLVRAGYLNDAGYPLSVPPGMAGIRTVWDWNYDPAAEGRKGYYIITYKGSGTVGVYGAAKATDVTPGRILFQNETGKTFWLDITAINPADPIRDLSIVRTEYAGLLEAGAMFDPVWISLVADARELRFSDWMMTNTGQAAVTWDERPLPDDASWSDQGAPVETMVRLANEAGVDPWFNMPHAADDTYVRAFAAYVRDHLDPRLKAHVEYSNETWNSAFPQFHWLRDQAIQTWGPDVSENWDAIFSYHGKRATEVAMIWEEVFGAESDTRLINILGTQTGHVYLTERLLAAPEWALREPATFVAPTDVFEELAATTYFGSALVSDPALRPELIARAKTPASESFPWAYDQIAQTGAVEDSIPVILQRLADQQDQAEAAGLRLVAYEGGQHVHHSFAVEGLSEAEVEVSRDMLTGFVRSEKMGQLYAQIWDGWRAVGQGPFMHYVEMSTPTVWGSWGLLAYPGDTTQRSAFILSKQAEGGSWWGEGGGPQYLQGISATGSDSNDRLEGTDEEDFLAGGPGDDVFVASAGTDGVSGGEGEDSFDLPGRMDDYSITREGTAWHVAGPEGTTRLVGVEVLRFGDGRVRRLD